MGSKEKKVVSAEKERERVVMGGAIERESRINDQRVK